MKTPKRSSDRTKARVAGPGPRVAVAAFLAFLLFGPPAATVGIAGTMPLSGTIQYTGSSGSVSETTPIVLVLFSDPLLEQELVASTSVGVNGGEFSLDVPAPGNYYLAYALVLHGEGPGVGSPAEIFDNRTTLPADPITVPHSGLTLEFDDSLLLPGIGGMVTYTGTKGPVSGDRPIVVMVSDDAQLTSTIDTTVVTTNGGGYEFITLGDEVGFVWAFLDIDGDRQLSTGEPFTIYEDRSAPPADPIQATPQQTGIDIAFGDDNVLAPECVGDCNRDGEVTVDEILTGVNIAIGFADIDQCLEFDVSGDGEVTVDEILQAVTNALEGCAPPAAG